MKRTIFFLALMLPTLVFAQWRVGANVGLSYNHPTIDKQYMTDLVYKDRCGLSFGLMGQYDFNDWLGVRAELDWVQKNYRQTRNVAENQDYKFTNDYLLMPVMASFSFGGEKLRGFCNVGVYGGYWLNSHRKGECQEMGCSGGGSLLLQHHQFPQGTAPLQGHALPLYAGTAGRSDVLLLRVK